MLRPNHNIDLETKQLITSHQSPMIMGRVLLSRTAMSQIPSQYRQFSITIINEGSIHLNHHEYQASTTYDHQASSPQQQSTAILTSIIDDDQRVWSFHSSHTDHPDRIVIRDHRHTIMSGSSDTLTVQDDIHIQPSLTMMATWYDHQHAVHHEHVLLDVDNHAFTQLSIQCSLDQIIMHLLMHPEHQNHHSRFHINHQHLVVRSPLKKHQSEQSVISWPLGDDRWPIIHGSSIDDLRTIGVNVLSDLEACVDLNPTYDDTPWTKLPIL
jgi:hypothetical protein